MKMVDNKEKDYILGYKKTVELVPDPNAANPDVKPPLLIDEQAVAAAAEQAPAETPIPAEVSDQVRDVEPSEEAVQLQEDEITVAVSEEVQDDREEGYEAPLDTEYGRFAQPESLGQEGEVTSAGRYPDDEGYLKPPARPQPLEETADVCCVQDAPVQLRFTGLIIFNGQLSGGTNDPRTDDDAIGHGDSANCGCCCDVPDVPLPNYEITYTNCDGVAYLQFLLPMAPVEIIVVGDRLITYEDPLKPIANFSVVLSAKPTSIVEVVLSSSDNTEAAVLLPALIFTPDNWSIPQIVSVQGIDDQISDGDISYTIELQAASLDLRYNGLTRNDITGVNIDDDINHIIVSSMSSNFTTENGDKLAFGVQLSSAPTGNVTVELANNKPGEASLSVSYLVFTPTNWNIPQIVTVTGLDDDLADGAVSYTISLSAPGYSDTYVNLVNYDNEPGITIIADNPLVTSENGTAVGFQIFLNTAPTSPVTINLNSSNTAEGTLSVSFVTFDASNWNIPQIVTVTGVDDSIEDGNVPYMIITSAAISDDASYSGLDVQDLAAVNTDNDEPIKPLTLSVTDDAHSHDNLGNDDILVPANYELLKVGFYPGFEPECGCDIVEIHTNVYQAKSLNDFINVNLGERPEDYNADQSGRYETYFIDSCGIAWSIIYGELFGGDADGGGGSHEAPEGYAPGYSIVPVVISPVEIDTICYYSKTTDNIAEAVRAALAVAAPGVILADFTSSSYNDGSYNIFNNFYLSDTNTGGEVKGSRSLYNQFSFSFGEIQGDSILLFSFTQDFTYNLSANAAYNPALAAALGLEHLAVAPGTDISFHDTNQIDFIIDVPDNIDFQSGKIDNFILGNPVYNQMITDAIQEMMNSYASFYTTGNIPDTITLDIAKLILESFTSYGGGVFEDIHNQNIYQLSLDSNNQIDLSPFIIFGVQPNNAYRADVIFGQATGPQTSITPVEIEVFGDIVGRFNVWQAMQDCDSTYGDPIAYIQQYISAHIVTTDGQRYLEINYPVLTQSLGNGYSQAENATFRINLYDIDQDGKIGEADEQIIKIRLDGDIIFQSYYANGYVDFSQIFRPFSNNSLGAIRLEAIDGDLYQLQSNLSTGDGPIICPFEVVPVNCDRVLEIKMVNPDANVTYNFDATQIRVAEPGYDMKFSFEVHDTDTPNPYLSVNYYIDGLLVQLEGMITVDLPDTINCDCPLDSVYLDANDFAQFISDQADANFANFVNNYSTYLTTGNVNFKTECGDCYELELVDLDGNGLINDLVMQSCNCIESPVQVMAYTTDAEYEHGQSLDTMCFDQFFSLEFVKCNDMAYIELTWHYKSITDSTPDQPGHTQVASPEECFNFPNMTSSILISMQDQYADGISCPITKVEIPPAQFAQFAAQFLEYFADCCSVSDNVGSNEGYTFADLLLASGAIFYTACGDTFTLQYATDPTTGPKTYELVPQTGVDCYMPNIFTDENNLAGFNFMSNSFKQALDYASSHGDGLSLRELVILSNEYNWFGDGNPDVICLQQGTYSLTLASTEEGADYVPGLGDLDVLSHLVINGFSGISSDSIINSEVNSRVFDVFNGGNLTLNDLQVTGGNEQSIDGQSLRGGGIQSVGELHLDNVVVAGNSLNQDPTMNSGFVSGGGVYLEKGSIINSIIENNDINGASGANGGGVAAQGTEFGHIEITNSFIRDNSITTTGAGSGVLSGGGLVAAYTSIINTEISDNEIIVEGDADTVEHVMIRGGGVTLLINSVLENSLVFANELKGTSLDEGTAQGAGIYAVGDAEMHNVTVVGNAARLDAFVATATGGGIYVDNGLPMQPSLTNLTVANNVTDVNYTSAGIANGAGIYFTQDASSLQSSIVVNNTAANNGNISASDLEAAIATNAAGKQVIAESTVNVSNTISSDYETEFGSNTLNANGGPTGTIALVPGAHALDNGLAGGVGNADEFADQRGVTYQGTPDIGAYEYIGIDCYMPTSELDDNDFIGYDFTGVTFAEALDFASQDALSLRELVILSNHYDFFGPNAPDVICLDNKTYLLNLADADGNTDLDIAGSNKLIIMGYDNTQSGSVLDTEFTGRVLDVGASSSLELRNLTVTRGYTNGENGAGIRSEGILELDNVHVVNNQIGLNTGVGSSAQGAGVYMVAGEINDSNIEDNLIFMQSSSSINQLHGAGVFAVSSGDAIEITNSTISSNRIEVAINTPSNASIIGLGAGLYGDNVHIANSEIIGNQITFSNSSTQIFAEGAGAYLRRSTVSDSEIYNNQSSIHTTSPGLVALHAAGGGLFLGENNTVQNSAIFTNNIFVTSAGGTSAQGSSLGGGIFVDGLNNDIVNSTIALNTSMFNASMFGNVIGAGIYVAFPADNTYMSNLTVVSNNAVSAASNSYGGGIAIDSAPSVVIQSSIVLDNDADSGSDVFDMSNQATGSANIFGSANVGGGLTYTPSTYAAVFGTETLDFNGGPTRTVELVAGSPAIDAGLAGQPGDADELADQRGAEYVGTPDVGAYEYNGVVPPVILDLNHDGEISLISAANSLVTMGQLFGTDSTQKVGWAGPQDGFLMYDPEGTGEFHHINQISFVSYYEGAQTDLEGLLGFDRNQNFKLDKGDDAYDHFGVWQDMNSDGKTQAGEFTTLKMLGIDSIDLVSDNHNIMSEGNIVYGESRYTTSDGAEHVVADVGLAIEKANVDVGQVVHEPSNIDFSSMVSEHMNSIAANHPAPATVVNVEQDHCCALAVQPQELAHVQEVVQQQVASAA